MNHREYIIKVISADMVESANKCRAAQQSLVDECVNSYDKSTYHDLENIVFEAKKAVSKYAPLEKQITAKTYAEKLDITVATARKWLTMPYVVCNKSHRPYIYSL